MAGIGLRAGRDLVHHLDRFAGKLARGAFGRKHDRVGAVIDRGRHVGHFGAGRRRRADHRFQHLGRHHHWLAHSAGGLDDPFLKRRHVLGRKLDAEIAASDHHRVGQLQYTFETVDRRRLLDLGEQGGAAADQPPRFGHVLGALDEGQGDPVHILLERECEVLTVLVGQWRQRKNDVRDVQPLVVGDRAAGFDLGFYLALADRRHPENQLAVVDQEPGTGFDRLEYFTVR